MVVWNDLSNTEWMDYPSQSNILRRTYVNGFLDVSQNIVGRKDVELKGNMTINGREGYKWNTYGQVLSGNYESDNNVNFGVSVDMDDSGTTIVVGASKDNTGADEDGALYVYRYDTTAEMWYQLGNTITESTGSNTGRLVKISDNGNRIAYGSDNANEGYIYDYNSSTNTWDSAGYIQVTPDVSHAGGFELSGDGNTILFGDHNDGTYGSGTGTMVVYRNTSGTTWTKIGQLSSDNLGLVNSHTWGLGISYNGNRLLIGAPFYDDADGNVDSGLFWVLDYTGDGTASTDNSDWSQVGSSIVGSPSERLGVSGDMSSDGSIIVVTSSASSTPSAYVYQYDATVSGSWKLLGTSIGITNSIPHGACLSNDGTILLVNDYNDDTAGTDNGALYIYKYIDNDWVQQGSTIYGSYTSSAWGQDYGTGMAINADGTKVVAGGYLADLNGTNSGYVQAWEWSKKEPRVYPPNNDNSALTIWGGAEENPNNWGINQLGQVLYGNDTTIVENNTNNIAGMGASPSLNADGTILATSVLFTHNNSNNRSHGQILVFKYRNGTWGKIGTAIQPYTLSGPGPSVYTGWTLKLDNLGTTIAFCTHENSVGTLEVYKYFNGDWIPKGSTVGQSLHGVSINGDGNIVAGVTRTHVHAYQYIDASNNWVRMGNDISTGFVNSISVSENDRRVDLNDTGDIMAIGYYGDSTGGSFTGSVSVYKYDGSFSNGSWSDGSWNLLGNEIYLPDSESTNHDWFGKSVSLSNDGYTLVSTSQNYEEGAGRARVMKYSEAGNVWESLGSDITLSQLADTTGTGFASRACISGDGKTVLINNINSDVNATDAGSVSILKYIDGDWKEVQSHHHNIADEHYGTTIALSKDGKRFAGGNKAADGTIGFLMAHEITNNPDFKIENGSTIMNGNVGIGTTTPESKLDVNGTIRINGGSLYTSDYLGTPGLSLDSFIYTTGIVNNGEGGTSPAAITFGNGSTLGNDQISLVTGGNTRMYINSNGNVGIGTTNPSQVLDVGGNVRITGPVTMEGTNGKIVSRNNWEGGGNNSSYGTAGLMWQCIGPHSANGDRYWDLQMWKAGHFYFSYTNTHKGYVSNSGSNVRMNFTGQHRSYIEEIPFSEGDQYIGLIACANKNTYINVEDEPVYGKEAITINESLPLVSLCKKEKDKSCFGVISQVEDNNETQREYSQGTFVSLFGKQYGDNRFYINSVGEGALWVSNKNGDLESGDYITTASVPGYGEKQDDDFLHNYTVAKITMDCDFNPQPKKKKRILRRTVEFTFDMSSNNYYDVSGNVNIFTKPTFDGDNNNKTPEYRSHLYSINVDSSYNLVDAKQNVLDANGEIQWEDTGEQERAYEIRHLDPSGNIITEEEYNAKIAASEEAYIAAFVGCTYHCG
jgi:hypothetical protein